MRASKVNGAAFSIGNSLGVTPIKMLIDDLFPHYRNMVAFWDGINSHLRVIVVVIFSLIGITGCPCDWESFQRESLVYFVV